MTDLKTVLVDALNTSLKDNDFGNVYFVTGASERYDYDYDAKGEIGLEIEDCHYDMTIDADRLATAVRDHFLDREKVKALLLSLLEELDVPVDNQGFQLTDFYHDEDGTLFVHNNGHNNPEWGDGPLHEAVTTGLIPINILADRLIAGLAGGSSE